MFVLLFTVLPTNRPIMKVNSNLICLIYNGNSFPVTWVGTKNPMLYHSSLKCELVSGYAMLVIYTGIEPLLKVVLYRSLHLYGNIYCVGRVPSAELPELAKAELRRRHESQHNSFPHSCNNL